MKNNIKNRLFNLVNDTRFRRTAKTIHDLAVITTDCNLKSPISVCLTLFKSFWIFADNLEIDSYSYFDYDNSWVCPYSSEFSSIILDALKGENQNIKSYRTNESNININIIEPFTGYKIGWIDKSADHSDTVSASSVIWINANKQKEICLYIENLLWKKFNNTSITLTQKNIKTYTSSGRQTITNQFVIVKDELYEAYPSKIATDYSNYLKKFLDKDINRSILFLGPPGTGKTTAVQEIVKLLNLKCLRINVQDIGSLSTSFLYNLLDIFKPDCLVIDDVDRSCSIESLFELFSHIKTKLKLVFATANKISQLDDALLRPGRFDEIIPVKKLDDEVIKNILGEYIDEAYETVKDWPISYILEYKTRRMVMSSEETKKTLQELQLRVDRLKHYYEETEKFE